MGELDPRKWTVATIKIETTGTTTQLILWPRMKDAVVRSEMEVRHEADNTLLRVLFICSDCFLTMHPAASATNVFGGQPTASGVVSLLTSTNLPLGGNPICAQAKDGLFPLAQQRLAIFVHSSSFKWAGIQFTPLSIWHELVKSPRHHPSNVCSCIRPRDVDIPIPGACCFIFPPTCTSLSTELDAPKVLPTVLISKHLDSETTDLGCSPILRLALCPCSVMFCSSQTWNHALGAEISGWCGHSHQMWHLGR